MANFMERQKTADERRRTWLTMHDRSLPLSHTVSVLNRMARDLDEQLSDPYTVGSDCGRLIVNGQLKRMQQRAEKLGYPSLEYVRLHAEMRTTPRWVHFNLNF